jgi:putative transposase
MKYNPGIHHRRSIRLKRHDYAQAGEYYVTLCVKNRECLLGEIFQDQVKLSPIGEIAKACWKEIPQHFSNAGLDEFVIMPNHIHGILSLKEHAHDLVGVEYIQPQRGGPRQKRNEYQHVIPKSVGSIVRSFKGAVTRKCRQKELAGFRWQSGFYEHVIRNAKDLERIRRYILENPVNWNADDEHPSNVKPSREQMSYEGLSDLS